VMGIITKSSIDTNTKRIVGFFFQIDVELC
jgi:hypothetical protein